MMVRGDKVDVLKYLRTLPPEEGSVMRKKLLRGLEVIQNKGNESDEHGSSKSSGSQRSKGVNLPSARRDSSDVRNIPVLRSFVHHLQGFSFL